MMDTLISTLMKLCSTATCSRLSLVGVVFLTLWAVAHASDTRVAEAEQRAAIKAAVVAVDSTVAAQSDMKAQIEAARKEAKEANTETTRKLERLESLMLQMLRK